MRSRHAPRIAASLLTVAASLASVHAASAYGRAEHGHDTPDLVTLEVSSSVPGALAAAAAVTLAGGGKVLGDGPDLLLVEIPEPVTARLTAVVDGEVRPPIPVDVRPQSIELEQAIEHFGPTTGSQVEITNAQAWHDAGIDGTGIKIGVIDFFETESNWDVAEHGPLPVRGATALCLDRGADCTDEFFDGVDLGGERHGVAVVEVMLDMAPGAEIYIGQASTLTDYRALIDWFAEQGVTVVNRSLGSRFDGPGDGRGPLDDIASEAVAKGMLWVNSGGNNGEGHYYRGRVRLVGNQVAFGDTGSDTFLEVHSCVALGGMRWANDWDKAQADRTDYDLYLWESPTGNPSAGTIVDTSLRDQRAGAAPIELLTQNRCPTAGKSLYLEVRWLGGDTDDDVLEILDYGSGFTEHTQSSYSAAVSIVDSADHGVIAVGAIDPPGSGEIAPYSSQGPTNDGRVAPDVAAPADIFSTVYSGDFAGTSASAAVVTGGAALLLDAGLAAGPATLGDLVRSTTVERGDQGPDNAYGHGEFRLPTPPDNDGLAADPSRFVALDRPTRFLDTRPDTPVGPTELIGEVSSGEILELPITGVSGVPSTGVTAVVANLVTVEPDRWSYLQALPTLQAELGGYSNLNADAPGQTRANLAVVPVGEDGSISIYSVADGHVIVDVLGWFEATTGPVRAGRFVALPTPQRLLDSRVDAPIAALTSDTIRSVPMPSGIDLAEVDSVVVTVTSTEATDPGWLQAYPADQPDAIGLTSTLNIAAGSTVANTAIVRADTGGMAITGYFADGGSAHVIVDAIGYTTSADAPADVAGRFVSVTPNRAFDSRVDGGPVPTKTPQVVDATLQSGDPIPSDASGAIWNLTIVSGARTGYGRGWAVGQPEPATSSLNWTLTGETRAAAAVTALTGGGAQFVLYDGSTAPPQPIGDLIADVFGYFT